jgi:zinc transport system ATP-binding protein
MAERTAIRFDGVTFSFGGPTVLEDVSFEIAEGEFAAIIGPNGGGKTTMLKLMLGLLETQNGVIRIFGLRPEAARRTIGYMPQHPRLDPLFPVTVSDVVLLSRLGGGWKLGAYRRADREAAAAALSAVDLEDLSDRPFSALSSGQRQRALIARALASEPELLLLDEPTSNLDPSVQDELYELLHRLNKTLTVVVVSHDVGFVSKYVKKVVCVNRRAVLHPVSDIEGTVVSKLYGGMELRMVNHGQHSHD